MKTGASRTRSSGSCCGRSMPRFLRVTAGLPSRTWMPTATARSRSTSSRPGGCRPDVPRRRALRAMPAPTIGVIRDEPSLRDAWLRMRCELWPEASTDEHRLEIDRYFAGERRHLQTVLFAHDGNGRPLGFAELNIRPYAEGCSTDRVAFLEGWYVTAEERGRGVGAGLVAEAERWARERGCTEFASDVVAGNTASAAAHRALGFEEVETIICFRKDLEPRTGG